MKIAVIGSTGMVGSRVATEAANRIHTVDGYSRGGKAPEGVSAHAVDLADTAAIVNIINSHDVTVIAVPPARDGSSTEPIINVHRRLIAARPAGRLLIVGGAGSLENEQGVRFVDTADFPEDYKAQSQALSAVLDLYRASEGINWTMLSPAFDIEPGERTGTYKVSLDTPAGERVSAEDFAVALIDEAEKSQHIGRRFTVAN